MKFAPYIIMFIVMAGAFFYVKNIGKIECQNDNKSRTIDAGREDIEIEKRQQKHIANRDSYNLSDRLLGGTF